MLSLIGGSNFKQSVRRILRKLITNDYAKSFSYTGHKNNKSAFNQTILASLLISMYFVSLIYKFLLIIYSSVYKNIIYFSNIIPHTTNL